MKNFLKPLIFGLFVWFFATMFFVFLGKYVLITPGEEGYFVSLIILLLGTGILLYFTTKIYMLFDKTKYGPLKFGLIGTIIGLTLDTLSLSNYEIIFEKLETSQVISFAAWMCCAYALYIVIPLIINLKVEQTNKLNIFKLDYKKRMG
ncbi:hypothetical protein SAMN05880501_11061 [Ureibacillus xyleni]|uniref:Uncharacterized protein n=1 Tax=Ureibacillus xyleni TaxID=614648 RepID=A0A285TAX6_9BACL|nr:DUF5367 family protein [Ureibacillus xyleni]SOC18193.1 hypothetical protein SAMN05880501_11061 [Ureibacillus xyleni]